MMISCEEFVELVTEYLEGEGSMGSRMKFKFHEVLCKHCRQYVNQIKVTRDLLKYLPTPEADEATVQELVEKFRTLEADPEIDLPDEVS